MHFTLSLSANMNVSISYYKFYIIFYSYPNVKSLFEDDTLAGIIFTTTSFFIISGYMYGNLITAFIHKKQDSFIYYTDLITAKIYMVSKYNMQLPIYSASS